MQIEKLNIKNNKNLIVFFSGWGSIIPPNLNFSNFDVLLFHDYRIFNQLSFDFSRYEKKYLIAWSLGVYICSFYYDNFYDFDNFIAINGTLKPIDNNFGIPVLSYDLTINNFNEMTCKKFIKKISLPFEITKNIEDLKQELISIKNLKIEKFLPFNKAIISTKDKIFPYKNMLAFWAENNVKIEELDASHYVFNLFNSWSDLI